MACKVQLATKSVHRSYLALCQHFTVAKCQQFRERQVVERIEEDVRRTAHTWLEHFKLRGHEPHVIRLDFLVSVPPAPPNSKPLHDFQVHTCELTECGGATCGLHVRTRTAAVLNECMLDGQESLADFPKPLPPLEKERPQPRPEQPARASRDRHDHHAHNAQSRGSTNNSLDDARQPRRRLELFAALLAVALLLWQRKFSTTHLKRLMALPPIGLFACGAAAVYVVRNALT